MSNKKKSFDCVEMKNQIQQELIAEFENNQNQYASYVEFLNDTASKDPKIMAAREKINILQSIKQ